MNILIIFDYDNVIVFYRFTTFRKDFKSQIYENGELKSNRKMYEK